MDFEQLNQAISSYKELESPSFLQGMLIGLMCADNTTTESIWIKKLLAESNVKSITESFLTHLHQLYLDTNSMLNGADFDLELCLPNDSEDLNFRAALLGQFCEGFLYGMGTTGKTQKKLQGNVLELIKDFGSIAAIDVTQLNNQGDDENEESIMQLIEYVKIGVMTINEELNPAQANRIDTAEPPTKTLQ